MIDLGDKTTYLDTLVKYTLKYQKLHIQYQLNRKEYFSYKLVYEPYQLDNLNNSSVTVELVLFSQVFFVRFNLTNVIYSDNISKKYLLSLQHFYPLAVEPPINVAFWHFLFLLPNFQWHVLTINLAFQFSPTFVFLG